MNARVMRRLPGIVPPFAGGPAVMEQVPALSSVTRVPAVLHTPGVVEAMAIGRAEIVRAAIGNGEMPKIWSGIAPNEIVCAIDVIVNGTWFEKALAPLKIHSDFWRFRRSSGRLRELWLRSGRPESGSE